MCLVFICFGQKLKISGISMNVSTLVELMYSWFYFTKYDQYQFFYNKILQLLISMYKVLNQKKKISVKMNSHVCRCHQYFSNPLINPLLFQYIAQNYSEMYKVCSEMTTSTCSKPTRGLEYTIWGENIWPGYCGLKGFELSSEDDHLVVDVGTDSKYRVVSSRSLLTLKRYGDAVEKVCASSWDSREVLNKRISAAVRYNIYARYIRWYSCHHLNQSVLHLLSNLVQIYYYIYCCIIYFFIYKNSSILI